MVGDKVYAGSINNTGYIEIKVLKEAKDSTLNKIVKLTSEAAKKKAESQKFIEKFARYYTPAVTILALILFIGKPEVTDIIPFNGFNKEDVLSCSAGLGGFSEHPLSQSVFEKAKEEGINVHKFSNFQSIQGQGILGDCAVCTDIRHCLGKNRHD